MARSRPRAGLVGDLLDRLFGGACEELFTRLLELRKACAGLRGYC
jgi:hypothetical protein